MAGNYSIFTYRRVSPAGHWRGGNGWTALHYAATGRCVETCRVLLDHGAQVLGQFVVIGGAI